MNEKQVEKIRANYESRIGEVDDLQPVKARVSRAPRHVFSLRIGARELDTIAEAAENRGLSVGDFIRQAAMKEAASSRKNSDPSGLGERLDTIERKLEALAERVERSA